MRISIIITFSEALQEVIKEHNIIVKHLAEKTEINRTTLQHFIAGRRTPNKAQVSKLIKNIPIPAQDKALLLQAYGATTTCSEKSNQLDKVKAIIERIAFDFIASSTDPPSLSENILSHSMVDSEDLYGTHAIYNALLDILGGEDGSVSFFMPSNFPFFYDALLAKYEASPTLSVTCFFPISNESERKISDLEYFESFIPLFASPKHNFQAYYMRGQSPLHDTSIIPFPYFIHTSERVLLLSADINHAILTKQEAFVQMYYKKCQDLLSISSPLLLNTSVYDLLSYFPNFSSPKDVCASIEKQPCFQSLLTKQLIRKYIPVNTDEEAAIIKIYTKYIDELQKEPNFFSAFERAGLEDFAETGVIAVWPPSLGRPLDVPDRIRMLERMLNGIKSDEFHCRMVDTTKLTVPLSSTVIGVRRKTLLLQCLDYDNGNVKNILLTEKNILEAFTAFFEELPNSHYVHSKEETVKAFEDVLEKLVR